MDAMQRVVSASGEKYIDIVKLSDGSFCLHLFLKKYDHEEDEYYIIREFPGPSSKFGSISAAIDEANRLLNVDV